MVLCKNIQQWGVVILPDVKQVTFIYFPITSCPDLISLFCILYYLPTKCYTFYLLIILFSVLEPPENKLFPVMTYVITKHHHLFFQLLLHLIKKYIFRMLCEKVLLNTA